MTYPRTPGTSLEIMPFGLRNYWKGHFVRDLDAEAIAAVVARHERRQSARESDILLEAITGRGRAEPYRRRRLRAAGARWNASALAIWEDPADDAAQIAWARNVADRLGRSSLTGAGYGNYAPIDETADESGRASGTSGSNGCAVSRRATIRTTCSGSTTTFRRRRPAESACRGLRLVGASRASSGRTSCASRTPPAARRAAGRAIPRRAAGGRSAAGGRRRAHTAQVTPRAAGPRLRLSHGALELGKGLVEREALDRVVSRGLDRLRHRVLVGLGKALEQRDHEQTQRDPDAEDGDREHQEDDELGHHDGSTVAGSSPAHTHREAGPGRCLARVADDRPIGRAAHDRIAAFPCAAARARRAPQSPSRVRPERSPPCRVPPSRAGHGPGCGRGPGRNGPRARVWRGRAAGRTARGPSSAGPMG